MFGAPRTASFVASHGGRRPGAGEAAAPDWPRRSWRFILTVMRTRRKQGVATASLIRRMVRRMVEQFHPEQVILFGSYARGDARPDSDVD